MICAIGFTNFDPNIKSLCKNYEWLNTRKIIFNKTATAILCLLAAIFNNNNKPIQPRNACGLTENFLFVLLPPLFTSRINKKFSVSPQKMNKLRREKKTYCRVEPTSCLRQSGVLSPTPVLGIDTQKSKEIIDIR